MRRKKSVPYTQGLYKRLQNPEYAKGYLMACLESDEEGWEQTFLLALRDVAKAYGFKNISAKTKLGRESLYKAISIKGNPKLSTLISILDAVGLKLSIETKKAA